MIFRFLLFSNPNFLTTFDTIKNRKMILKEQANELVERRDALRRHL